MLGIKFLGSYYVVYAVCKTREAFFIFGFDIIENSVPNISYFCFFFSYFFYFTNFKILEHCLYYDLFSTFSTGL